MNKYRYTVSLRIRHPSCSPEYISKKLHLQPKYSWRANELRRSPKGNLTGGVYEETYCSFVLKNDPTIGLAEFITQSNCYFSKFSDFFQKIRKSGGAVEYFIGWFLKEDVGEIFDLGMLRKLAELGIELGICIYLPEDTEVKS